MVKLTEDERRTIVEKVAERVLNEISISQKKRNARDFENAFKKGKRGFNAIKTIVVLTSENPDSQEMSFQFNKKARKSLLSDLKQGGYAYVPAIGQFGNAERPYAVFNMSRNTAKVLSGRYQQTSFVYSQLNDDGSVHSEYWEKECKDEPYNRHHNDYILKDKSDEWEDMTDAEDYFTVVGNNFKYSIPFSIFVNTNEAISNNASILVEQASLKRGVVDNEDRLIEWTIEGVGMSPYLWRKALTRGISG